MRAALLATTMLVWGFAAEAQTACTAPPQAAAAGFTQQTFGPVLSLGQNVVARDSQAGITIGQNNTLIINGGMDNSYNSQLMTAPSVAFGGGGYFEATFSFTGTPSQQGGWPSFWGGTNPWASPAIETDIVEWFGPNNPAPNILYWPSITGSPIRNNTTTQSLPAGFDPSQPHKYGMLWTKASITFYIDGVKGPNTISLSGEDGLINSQKILLTAGTGPSNPMTVYSINVWQASAANDTGVTATSPSQACATPVTASSTPVTAIASTGSTTSTGGTQPIAIAASPVGSPSQEQPGGKPVPAVQQATQGQPSALNPQQPTATQLQAVAPTPLVCGNGVPAGAFKVSQGQIMAPNGQPFIARGLNLYDTLMSEGAEMTSMFIGLNFVRMGIHSYQSPTAYDSFVSQMTSAGRVVEFENHPDAGGGQDSGPPGGIPTESAWYAAMAQHFQTNPYVWFGTFNEPKGIPTLSAWQQATYTAIRNTGNSNPIIVYSSGEAGVLQPSVYANMTNIIWDVHYYGGGRTTATDQELAASIATSQSIRSGDGLVPALIGEYGDSQDGSNVDSNAVQAVTSVVNRGASGQNGSAAWAFNPGGNADRVQNNWQLTSPYGDQVALYINNSVQPCSTAEFSARAQQTDSTLQAIVVNQPPSSSGDTNDNQDQPPQPAPQPDPQQAGTQAATDQLDQQGDTSAAQAQQLLNSALQQQQQEIPPN